MTIRRKGCPIFCTGGPYDERTLTYLEPLPAVLVIADAQLAYHEYHRVLPHRTATTPIYRFTHTYRVDKDGTHELVTQASTTAPRTTLRTHT